jgi:hypothetical protein
VVRSGYVCLSQISSGFVRLCQVRFGYFITNEFKFFHVSSGYVSLVMVISG